MSGRNYFSKRSAQKLDTLDRRLQDILFRVIEVLDITIVCGYRDEEAQETAWEDGKSTKHYPDSMHNIFPSPAVDIAPYSKKDRRIVWDEPAEFIFMAGVTLAIANEMGIELIWGGDWDRDFEQDDESFRDLGHFELVKV